MCNEYQQLIDWENFQRTMYSVGLKIDFEAWCLGSYVIGLHPFPYAAMSRACNAVMLAETTRAVAALSVAPPAPHPVGQLQGRGRRCLPHTV
jgi:hypothetical protein